MRLAIVGATGEVGRTALSILTEGGWPVEVLIPLASARSAGLKVEAMGEEWPVEDLDSFDPSRVDVAVFSAGSSVSEVHAPRFVAAGCYVVDNSSQFRYDADKLLVVPEVNGGLLKGLTGPSIVANPNCSTIQIVVALKPILDAVGLERVNVATYQAVSGAGRKGIDQLEAEASGGATATPAFRKAIHGNVLPQIDRFEENGYTREEMKVIWESRKILGLPNLAVNCTAVRVPVVNGHSVAVHLETEQKLTAAEAKQLLRSAAGIVVSNDDDYPTARDVDGKNEVYVGRIREDLSHPRGLCLWVVADNLRKGAAYNALQIVRKLF